MIKMNKKANWKKKTKKKNILDKNANNFLKIGPIVCKKMGLYLGPMLKKKKNGYQTEYKPEPASIRDLIPRSNFSKPRTGVPRFRSQF
jgi:hypothetical protein